MKLHVAVLLLVGFPLCGNLQAQVFIPDTNARDVLNGLIPGIVDGAGIMDTLHPGIAGLDTATIVMVDGVTDIEVDGLQYLDAVVQLSILGSLGTSGQMTQVNALPPGMTSLHVRPENGTIDLPELPAGVRQLDLSGHHPGEVATVNIAGMPDSLDQLFIENYLAVAQWPDMPYADNLSMWNPMGDLTIGEVTAGVASISWVLEPVEFLTSIHTTNLYIDGCTFPAGVIWPAELRKLDLVSASFEGTSGTFPETLDSLTLEGMGPGCLEWLPDGLSYFFVHYFQVGYDCLPNWPSSLGFVDVAAGDDLYENTVEYCSVLNTTCPGVWPGVSGHILMDLNLNGQCDPGEPALPQAALTLLPNGYETGCDANGYWEIGVQPGNYTIAPSSTYPYYQSITPMQHTADLPNMGDADTLNNFAVTLIPGMQDLRAHFYSVPPRPGFDNRLYLTCENYGTVPMDAELTLSFTADQTWVGSSITPTAQTATSASWQLSGMAVGGSQQITVDLNTAASVPLGTPVEYTVTTLPTSGDQTPLDNVIVHPDTVVGSYDPNDKLLSPDRMSPEQVQAGQIPIEYTIRFQNTGTAAAERVVIVDTLPEGLQPQSVEFLSSSHSCQWYMLDGVLHFIHEGINLPDSTSDEPGSHGYVQFRILPDIDLVDGETVMNIAHIVFDFNEPIVTSPATFRVDVSASVEEQAKAGIQVHPNPVRDRLWIAFPRTEQAQVSYAVQDLLGRKLMTGRMSTDVPIDVSCLPCGVFVLTIQSGVRKESVRFAKQ